MRRALRSRSIKKIRKRIASGITIHFRKKKPNYMHCGICGKKIVRSRLRPYQLKKLPKTKKRPERPLPHLCAKCMREALKRKIRG